MRFFTILLAASLTAGAQQPVSQAPSSQTPQNQTPQNRPTEPAREDLVFSVTSTLVQIDAVVLDKKGRQVTDLGPGDFEVLIDGKPQRITNFSYIRVTPDAPKPQQAPADKKRADLATQLPPPLEVKREDVHRTIVLMVDDLGLSFEDMAFTRRALHRFVERQMQTGDLVAVCRTAVGSGALQTFTTDKRLLTSVIDHLRWDPEGRGGPGLYSNLGLAPPSLQGDARGVIGGAPEAMPQGFERMQQDSYSQVGTLVAVQHVVNALRELPGRKSVVLFSDGLSLFVPPSSGHQDRLPELANDVIDALKALTDRANRSGTVLYTMDVRGLQPLTLDASYNLPVAELSMQNAGGQMVSELLSQQTESLDQEFNSTQQGLETVALLTGGLAYQNGNDLNYGLDRVLEDQKGYYLLGFHPEDGVFKLTGGQARFNRVKVKVLRAGLSVRSRTGFYGETDEQSQPKNQSRLELLRASMMSPFRSSDIRVRATPIYSDMTKVGPLVRNLLHIDIRDLEFEPQLDGSSKARIDLLAVAVGAGDFPLAAMGKPFVVSVPKGQMERARGNGVVYALDLAVKQPGPYQFRMAVRDRKTGKTGSASQYMEIPDLKRTRLALTSVVLGNGDARDGGVRMEGLTPARRQFKQGEVLQYFCLLEAGRKQHGTFKGELDARIRILHDDKEIYSGVAPLGKTAKGQPAVVGKVKLTGAIAPGEYYLQVIAHSREGKRESMAAQWTDFEVVN